MPSSRFLAACLALLLSAGAHPAAQRDGEWLSYRDAYRAMVVFDKYGGPKQFLLNRYQVMPKDAGVAREGLRLTLSSGATQLNLALDATGRTTLPLLKAAYDENAALLLNRPLAQYVLRPRVSLQTRPDGVYEAADLRAACAQALAFARHIDAGAAARQCVGVRFVFAAQGGQPSVRLRGAAGISLPLVDGAAFADDPQTGFRVVNYRFADTPPRGQVATDETPLAIAPLIE